MRPGAKPVLIEPAGPPGALGWPSPGILLGAALTTAPLAFRRIYPIAAFCVILAAVIGTSRHTTSITFAAAIFAAYSAVAYSPFRRAGPAQRAGRGGHRDGRLPEHHAAGAGTLSPRCWS